MDEIRITDWNIEEMTGYKPKTSFYRDFSIAEPFGEKGIRDTYKRAFKGWKTNYEYLTELVMVLNWKTWEHHDNGNRELSLLYYELWSEADEYATENLKGEELDYFYQTTD